MKLKERKWDICKCCNQRTKIIQEDSYGCDTCRKSITDALLHPTQMKYSEVLGLMVFWKDDNKDKDFHFCSWNCLFKMVKLLIKRKDINFMSLPYLAFDNKIKDQSPKEFISFIKIAKKNLRG